MVEWLNEAALATDNEKVEYLQKITEIVVNKESDLLEEFVDHILAFQIDRSQEVKKTVVTFVELTG